MHGITAWNTQPGSLVETFVMEAAIEPVVLIAREGALMSVLSARLAMAGETPVTATSPGDKRLDDGLRARAVLVIESSGLSCNPEEAVALLRAEGWVGKLLLLVDRVPDQPPPNGVAWIDCRGGTAAIMTALAGLRGR
jgi:hypothetical protein